MSTSSTLHPAELPADSFRLVRLGVMRVLVALAALLLLVAAYYAWNARELATVKGTIPGSWGEAFRATGVWSVLLWTAVLGVGCLAGVAALRRCRDDQPALLTLVLTVLLFGFAVAMAAMSIFLLATGGFEVMRGTPLFLWAVAMTLAFGGGGLALLLPQTQDAVRLRLTIMGIGGGLGLLTLILGCFLPLTTYRAPLAQGLDQWRKEWDAVLWPSLAVFGSLVLMFLSLLLGRGLERQNQNIRRLIYGYNAVMTGLLLLAVLGLVNVLAYAEPFTRFFGRPFDWTETNTNSVSTATRALLASLQEPVTVISFLRQGTMVEADARTLLDNCKSLTPKFTWRALPPEQENAEEIVKLMQKYGFSDPNGLLVLVGGLAEQNDPASTFIKSSDMVAAARRDPRRDSQGHEFTGELALLGALQAMIEGKMTIYLTQGHGELSPDGAAAAAPMPPGGNRPEGPLGVLRQKLTRRRGVEFKTLTLDTNTKAIPNDAAIVLVVRPTREFAKEEVSVLRDYLKRTRQTAKVKGKSGKDVEEETVTTGRLLLLAEPYIQREGDNAKILATGLEPLLEEYGVALGKNRILSFDPDTSPTTAYYEAYLNPDSPESSNPIALAFAPRRDIEQRLFPFPNARTVEPTPDKGGDKTVDRLFVADWHRAIRAETDASRDPSAVVGAGRRSRAELMKVISRTNLTVAVAVSDRGAAPGAPRDNAHAGITKDTPRMVVFGSSAWVTNENLGGAIGLIRMDILNNCISWLREKGTLGEGVSVDPKERKPYELGIPPQNSARTILLPIGLMLLGVMGLGLGVWVVRRR